MGDEKLDEQIVVRVMGWRIADHPEKNGTGQWMSEYGYPVYFKPSGAYIESGSFRPSEEIEAAMEVVEKLTDSKRDRYWELTNDAGKWDASIWQGARLLAGSDSASLPEAICRTAIALLAMESKPE